MADTGRNIPMRLSDFSVIDSEFNSIRERFDAEMRKMEDEMAKFRQELLNRESSAFSKSTSSSQQSEFKKWRETRQDGDRQMESSESKEYQTWSSDSGKGTPPPPFKSIFDNTGAKSNSFTASQSSDEHAQRTWLDGLNSPLIQDADQGKVLKLRFDVSQYVPEEIIVKTIDNKLHVNAKHEEKSDNRSVYREYNREFLLPQGTNPETIRSSLSRDGVLTVEAPLPASALPAPKIIPIEHR